MANAVKRNYFQRKYDSAKRYANDYKDDINKSFTIGYNQGWSDRDKIPNRRGAEVVATYGYGTGLRDRRRSDGYQRKLNGKK